MSNSMRELVTQHNAKGDSERPRVLVVEDDEALRRALTRTLKSTFEVTAVADGTSAAELVVREPYDTVLSDVGLPGMSGVDLLRVVRGHDLDVPVVLMTGQPTMETAIAAIEGGAFTYMQKPFAPTLLRETLSRTAKLARLARARREAVLTSIVPPPSSTNRPGLAKSFDRALDSMSLVYQPVVDRRSRQTIGFEALLRTEEPTMTHPTAVLEAAEVLDRVDEVGRRVRQIASESFRPADDQATLFVNLHPDELLDPDLYDPNAPLTKMAPMVVLEITERSAIEGIVDTKQRAAKLRKCGYRIAIDDLGAGFAGLTSFATLEPEVVKLDMSLIRDINASPMKKHIVQSMTRLCRDLEMRVVAEGIETKEELSTVVGLGCDWLQGYFLGRPGIAIESSLQQW